MYHFIYKTTNMLNGKFYIGKHSTDNLNDGYFGSGSALRKAVNKHGLENFKVTILEFFETEIEAVKRERELVTREFCQQDDVYNINAANQAFTWSGKTRDVDTRRKISEAHVGKVMPEGFQSGERNHQFGKTASNARKIRVMNDKLGVDIEVDSLRLAAEYIGMDRANARKLLQGVSKSRKGWVLKDVTHTVNELRGRDVSKAVKPCATAYPQVCSNGDYQ